MNVSRHNMDGTHSNYAYWMGRLGHLWAIGITCLMVNVALVVTDVFNIWGYPSGVRAFMLVVSMAGVVMSLIGLNNTRQVSRIAKRLG